MTQLRHAQDVGYDNIAAAFKTTWGSDVLFSRALAQQQGAILASLVRWYGPAEALATAARANAELLAWSGKRSP